MHKKIRIISEENHQNLLAAAGDRLLRLFLEFLWLTGTTYKDALRLRSANIDWSARMLSFTRLKHRGAPAAPMVRMPIGEDLEKILRELGETIDLVFISDDLGTQESQLISLSAWQEHLQPRLTRWCDLIHSHGKKVLFHTDGAACNFIPHLIESGVDVLNPIQHICPGMERSALKRDFGDMLIFHGGVENQHVLPHGTKDDVRREVRTCLETLGAGGGYIPSSCHNIQAGTPPENVIAMIETVQTWKG